VFLDLGATVHEILALRDELRRHDSNVDRVRTAMAADADCAQREALAARLDAARASRRQCAADLVDALILLAKYSADLGVALDSVFDGGESHIAAIVAWLVARVPFGTNACALLSGCMSMLRVWRRAAARLNARREK
jgi:hypothetical protein